MAIARNPCKAAAAGIKIIEYVTYATPLDWRDQRIPKIHEVRRQWRELGFGVPDALF